MAARTITRYTLVERPEGDIIPGKTFRKETCAAPTADELKDGRILVEALYFSLDPANRVWLNGSERNYTSPIPIGGLMRGIALSRVLASKNDKVKTGDLVIDRTGWQDIAIASEGEFSIPPPLPSGAHLTDLLATLGVTGLTAHVGLSQIGKIEKGDTVVVSAAAGATGSIVGQIAKIQGAGKVIGTAGSDAKCKWLTEVAGFDVALNYKDPDFDAKFLEATKDKINVYWDNVGAHQLDLAFGQAALNSRFVICGMIGMYNSPQGVNFRNIENILFRRIKVHGFIFSDYPDAIVTARKDLAQWLSEGKIQRAEHLVKGSMDDLEATWQLLYTGANTGKLILQVKNPENDN